MSDITIILQAINRGEAQISEDLLPLVYDELRHLAAVRMARELPGQTLQPTALVHEVWLRLVGDKDKTWENRGHFFGAAAEAMRRILIENARRKARVKHGGGKEHISLDELDVAAVQADDKILLVNEALLKLEEVNPERARIVMLKFFGGLTNEEVARTMGIGIRTVNRQWTYAKAWLFQAIRSQA